MSDDLMTGLMGDLMHKLIYAHAALSPIAPKQSEVETARKAVNEAMGIVAGMRVEWERTATVVGTLAKALFGGKDGQAPPTDAEDD